MITTILAALSIVKDIASTGLTHYQERKEAEHQVKMAEQKAKSNMAQAVLKAELELGHVQVKSTGRWFKCVTFFLWIGPFIISSISPEHGAQIFKNWEVMPEWYSQSCLVLIFAVWGIQVGKPAIMTMFANLGHAFRKRQQLSFNRKIFYDVVRSTSGNLSEHEVKIYEKAIKAAEELK